MLYESGRITEAACMTHARRKIHDVHARAPTDITTEALQRIGELYAIEAEVRGERDNASPDMEFDIVTVSHLFRSSAE